MEFVAASELKGILEDNDLEQLPPENDCIFLGMLGDEVTRHHFVPADGEAPVPRPVADGAIVHRVSIERVHEVFEGIIHRLHLDQVVIVPVARWSHLFDGIAFSLAENEDWQEFDAAATVERNTRDPLLVLPADFPTIADVMMALLRDCEELAQSVMVLSPAVPLLVTLVPGGTMQVACGTPVIADELTDILEKV